MARVIIEDASTERPSASSLDYRQAIPAGGLREYWYPGLLASKVGRRRPKSMEILGETVVFFRGASGEVAAIADACPHRGAALSRGHCHFKGTLTCPYHGWTFDEAGECLAVIGEGTDSVMPGQPTSRARMYPTRTLKGVVFVWMGEGPAVAIEEDVPPEFFEDDSLVMHSVTSWPCNWRPAMENKLDGHVFYVHRNSLRMWTHPEARVTATLHRWDGMKRPRTKVINGRALAMADAATYRSMKWSEDTKKVPFRYEFPGLQGAKWPRTKVRAYWGRLMMLTIGHLRGRNTFEYDAEWSNMHLPAIVRVNNGAYLYTRALVPATEKTTRVFYFHTRHASNSFRRTRYKLMYHLFYNWFYNRNFSGQDSRVVIPQHYDTRETFSPSDGVTVDWRRLVVGHARQWPRTSVEEVEDLAEARTSSG